MRRIWLVALLLYAVDAFADDAFEAEQIARMDNCSKAEATVVAAYPWSEEIDILELCAYDEDHDVQCTTLFEDCGF